MKKRALSLILAAVMLFSLTAMSAAAAGNSVAMADAPELSLQLSAPASDITLPVQLWGDNGAETVNVNAHLVDAETSITWPDGYTYLYLECYMYDEAEGAYTMFSGGFGQVPGFTDEEFVTPVVCTPGRNSQEYLYVFTTAKLSDVESGAFYEQDVSVSVDYFLINAHKFTDLQEGAYYCDPIYWALDWDITNGYGSAYTFCPDVECTRGQVVTFLWRAAGCPAPISGSNPFTDVKEGQFYTDAVLWAVQEGITKGLNATTFGVNEPCTRSQVVTFLHRFAGSPAPTSATNPFADVKENQFYTDAILWAVEEDITNGLNATTFGVDVPCNRAQVVTFLYRAIC